jgi:lipid II:glycine glycyltransferase (peptidoglycan interpeptide bridge formation enzyme)
MKNREGFLKELAKADLAVCGKAASFLQSGFWGGFKAQFGWEAFAFRTVWETESCRQEEKTLLVLRRRLAPVFALAYVPWGPELPDGVPPQAALEELAKCLKKKLPKDTAFIRFDPPWLSGSGDQFAMPSSFIRSEADIQPPDSVILDLTQPMDLIIESMKPKWRYNYKLALKKGVKVKQAAKNEIAIFYKLLQETSKRDRIAIHGFDYYKALFENDWNKSESSCGIPEIRLYLAEHDGETLAGIVTLFRGTEAVYLYGASSDKKRNFMPSYALQLKAIEEAKNHGCKNYDFFGIPPSYDPAHPMAGLYQFKTGFGGTIIHRPGSWDFPYNIAGYHVFRFAEKLRSNLKMAKKSQKQSNDKLL